MNESTEYLTLVEVSQCVHLATETVVTIVEHGIVEPRGARPQDWRFAPTALGVLRRATRLQRDLELDWPAVALALELIDELELLREDNRRLRQQLACLIETD